MIIFMYFKMNRRNKEVPGTISYVQKPLPTQETSSDYQSNWYLHTAEPIYQEPILKIIKEGAIFKPDIKEEYSVPKGTNEDSAYSSPLETHMTYFFNHSTLSSVSTTWSSLEEYSVDSSSATSTPRLPHVPSSTQFGNSGTLSPIYKYSSSKGPIYSNILSNIV